MSSCLDWLGACLQRFWPAKQVEKAIDLSKLGLGSRRNLIKKPLVISCALSKDPSRSGIPGFFVRFLHKGFKRLSESCL